jgi:hypothetical protein
MSATNFSLIPFSADTITHQIDTLSSSITAQFETVPHQRQLLNLSSEKVSSCKDARELFRQLQ